MFLGFFILKFLKSETLLVLLAEAKLVVLSVTLSLKLHNQFGFRACEKIFTNRESFCSKKVSKKKIHNNGTASLVFFFNMLMTGIQ